MAETLTAITTSLLRCMECRGPLPAAARTGRPRRYCSDDCRDKAKVHRRTSGSWQALGDTLAEVPADPLSRQQATLEAVAALLDGRPAGPPEDRLAQGLLEVRQIVFTLRRLAGDLPPPLRFRALGLADAMSAGQARYFGEVL